MFQINDYVFIRPTGDQRIDAFVGQRMTVVDVIPVDDCGYKYIQYQVMTDDGERVNVNSDEVRKAESNA